MIFCILFTAVGNFFENFNDFSKKITTPVVKITTGVVIFFGKNLSCQQFWRAGKVENP